MPVFEELPLEWEGKKYSIPPDEILRAIAKVEEVVTLGELSRFQHRANIPVGKLSQAFGVLLRHAGAQVTDDQVYEGMFNAGAAEMQRRAMNALGVLFTLMLPPAALRKDEKPGKPEAAGKRAGSSRSATSS